ncbi:MAG: uncharacterized protein PWP60_1205 [Candidatus Atribacteria bacterium]|nr:uncharacterized protein [Candidatus Atribacteria bacterium]
MVCEHVGRFLEIAFCKKLMWSKASENLHGTFIVYNRFARRQSNGRGLREPFWRRENRRWGIGCMGKELVKSFEKLIPVFESYPEIKLVYLFGSRATGKHSPLSDCDFAVYLDTDSFKRMHDIRFELYDRIGRILKEDNVDIVILNLVESPEFKYLIIKEGKLIFEREPYKVLVEPGILNEYFDFQMLLRRYGLTGT